MSEGRHGNLEIEDIRESQVTGLRAESLGQARCRRQMCAVSGKELNCGGTRSEALEPIRIPEKEEAETGRNQG